MIKNADEVKGFLASNNNPSVTVIKTIKDGYVGCISPVHGLFGAELQVSRRTWNELTELLRAYKQKTPANRG